MTHYLFDNEQKEDKPLKKGGKTTRVRTSSMPKQSMHYFQIIDELKYIDVFK